MAIVNTRRLTICQLRTDDARFIQKLVNQPSWMKYIGDRNVHSLDDARAYILDGPIAMYRQHGYGLYLVKITSNKQPIGICGLLKRDSLPHPDIGFAFLPEYWNKGYALEATTAVLSDARDRLGIKEILAITSVDNTASISLLDKLGFEFQKTTVENNGKAIDVYFYQDKDLNTNQ